VDTTGAIVDAPGALGGAPHIEEHPRVDAANLDGGVPRPGASSLVGSPGGSLDVLLLLSFDPLPGDETARMPLEAVDEVFAALTDCLDALCSHES